MKFTKTYIPEVIMIEPTIFSDHRGLFFESYQHECFKINGIDTVFTQDNQSNSKKGVLRGLHYQKAPFGQAKLVRVVKGEIFDVAIDLRQGSPTYGKWVGEFLSARNRKMLYIPPEFAHGFFVLSESASVVYKCSSTYNPKYEESIVWNDPTLNINWPIPDGTMPILSEKDSLAPKFN